MKWGQITGAALIGFLLGLAYCYWKAISAVYKNRDLISAGSDAISAGQNLYSELRKL